MFVAQLKEDLENVFRNWLGERKFGKDASAGYLLVL